MTPSCGCLILSCPQEELCVGSVSGFWVERAKAQQQQVRGKEVQREWRATSGKEHQEWNTKSRKQRIKAWNEAGKNSEKSQGVREGMSH